MSSSTEPTEEQKKITRMNIIYKALEDGWSVRKSGNDSKTFEFTKNKSLEEDYKGLVIFSKSSIIGPNQSICDDIQKHLDNIKKKEEKPDKKPDKKPDTKRSVSTPIIKNKEA